MIVDHVRNRENYYFLGSDFKAALDFFATIKEEPFEKADIRVENSGVTVKARPMQTTELDEWKFEFHKKYADIHFVAYGVEKIGYADVKSLNELSFDADKDVGFLEGKGDLITLKPGYFMITLPDDAHLPCICDEKPAPLGKMIAKVKL